MTTTPRRLALMLETDGPGGAEVIVFQLACELRDRGHEITPVGIAGGSGWLRDKYRDAGFDPVHLPERRPPDWRLVGALAGTFRERRVELVHSHEFTFTWYGAWAAGRCGIPHVATLHGNQTMTDAWRRRVALRWAFRRSASVVAVSDATRVQLLADLKLPPGAISVIHNGIPERPGDAEPVRRELGVREGELLIIAVGNLDPRKGHIHLLEALAILEDAGLDVPWRVAIAGGRGGPERERLEAFAREHGWADRVHILTQRDDIPNLQAAADIFSMPSLWEGLPLAVLEAMLSGTVVLASETSGIPEAIREGEHGLLAAPGDSADLARQLGRLLREPELREKLAAGALARARREFTIHAMAGAYEEIYGAALEGGSST
ncbi:MAG: glycosyltransferase family 4 protein [Myxococcota bacterium]